MKYQCPCCGFYTLEENASGEICPVCFWERDKASEEEPGFEGGANNGISLNQARKNYVSFGACDEKLVTYVRAPKEEENFWTFRGRSAGTPGKTNEFYSGNR